MQFEFSAGGIVYKNTADNRMILLAQHSGHHGWIFPKGHIGDKKKGETKEEAALREVREETGVVGSIIKELSPVTYWYVRDGEKIKKTVTYFLMEYLSGNITNHDHETENVEWLTVEKVVERLTFKSDKQVWDEAKK